MTRSQYNALWQSPLYKFLVATRAAELKSDGCTDALPLYVHGCFEHDISYRTGRDLMDNKISRAEADQRLRWYIQLNSPLGVCSPMAWWRWAAVRMFGGLSWKSKR